MNTSEYDFACTIITDLGRRAQRLYLGRTYFPEQRLLEHARDSSLNKLFTLYRSSDRARIAAAESRLLSDFQHLPNLANVAQDSRGNWVEGMNCIYVAWVWRGFGGNRKVNGRAAVEVSELPHAPSHSDARRYLATRLSRLQASASLTRR